MATVTEDRGALRPKEAAAWLGLSRDTFDRLCAAGELLSYKVGAARFVSRRELERFVAEREAEAR
ncbi:MAG: helix-turn-helix domain-containing protein [Dehalococcoidia bacterium]|nr:helix-turn-helix domain-containing protein [Dehalococcoidia bacterium]